MNVNLDELMHEMERIAAEAAEKANLDGYYGTAELAGIWNTNEDRVRKLLRQFQAAGRLETQKVLVPCLGDRRSWRPVYRIKPEIKKGKQPK